MIKNKHNNIDISIIVPLFHGSVYLDDIVKMIKKNGAVAPYLNLELIIVNDSPDDIPDFSSLKKLKIETKIIINNDNLGIQSSRLKGVNNAKGKYLFFLDQDDKIADNALVTLYNDISNADVAVSDWKKEQLIDNDIHVIDIISDISTFTLKEFCNNGNVIGPPGHCLIRKSSLPKCWTNQIMKINCADDYLLWLGMILERRNFVHCDSNLYLHKIYENNCSNDKINMFLSEEEAFSIAAKDYNVSFFWRWKHKRKIKYLIREYYASNDKNNTKLKGYLRLLMYPEMLIPIVIRKFKIMFKGNLETFSKINTILNNQQKRSIIAIFFLMILSSIIEVFGISLIIPYFAIVIEPKTFINSEIGVLMSNTLNVSNQNKILIMLTGLLILAFGLKYLLTYIINIKQSNFVNDNRFIMAKRIMNYLILEDFEDYLYRNVSEEINLVTTQVTWAFELIRAYLSMTIQIINVLLLSIFALVIDKKITFYLAIGFTPIYLILNKIFKDKVKLAGDEANSTWDNYEKQISESFMLKKENTIFNRENKVFDLFCYYGKKNIDADDKKIKYSMIPGLATSLFGAWTILFYVIFSLAFDSNIIIKLGKLSSLYFAITHIIPGINKILVNRQAIIFYYPGLEKTYRIIKSNNNIISGTSERMFYKLSKSIKLEDVTFKYKHANTTILEKINLEVNKGEKIGIVGRTGSGKTTLVNIIIGLLKPTSGKVYINSKILLNDNIVDVGYVPQETNLLDATIKDNIVFNRNVSEIELNKVIKNSGLEEFIDNLEDGIDTKIGSQGMRLSGGQKQRIGIARALIGSPSLLIFDEATSSLDAQTEAEVIRTITNIKNDTTVIMITHRPNTLKFCDKWYLIKNHKLQQLRKCP